ncbi:BOLA class I histocompatibility antigen, alpha chain BL3-7-like isoform X1, partial [Clarias magur]
WNILYNATLRTNIPELIAVIHVGNVLFFRYPVNITEKKRKDDLWKSRVQYVGGHQGDLNTFLHLILKELHHTEGSLQLLMSCDGDNVNFTRAYMKFISGNSFISFHLKNESWTLSNDQAEIIRRSLDPEYAQNAKTILQEECGYWNEQYARENHEREDNHSPQNTTAIPSTLSEGTKKQFPSSDKEKSDDAFLRRVTVKALKVCTMDRILMMYFMLIAVGGEVSAASHTLQCLTAVTPKLNFTIVNLDGERFLYCDSNTREVIPDRHKKNDSDEADFREKEKALFWAEYDDLQHRMQQTLEVFNHAKNHTFQWMYGCELVDENTIRGYDEFGYNGEDFIRLNLKTETWTVATPQAVNINKWDPDHRYASYRTRYLTEKEGLEEKCIDRLRHYMSYGTEILMRKVVPEVSVFQTPQEHTLSPEVVCLATGFFPKAVMITWQKDGEDVHEDVDLRETLPNQDGSFQKSSILKVPAEELQKHTYTCVVQHSSLEKELVREVPK